MNDSVRRRFPDRYAALLHMAQTQPIAFRQEAEKAYTDCPRPIRIMANQLDKMMPTAIMFFISWHDQLLPRLEKLHNAPDNTRLTGAVRSALLADDEAQRQAIIATAVAERVAQEQQSFVTAQYMASERRAYESAMRFVMQPISVCREQMEQYVTYMLYRDVSAEARLAVVDSQRGKLTRLWQCWQVRRQNTRLKREVRHQHVRIDREMVDIERLYDGIVPRLFTLGIDYVTVLAARREYEKAVDRLSKKAAESLPKRLALYEKKTELIRSEHLIAMPEIKSLAHAHQVAHEVDTVLLRVFELDATQRNEVMKMTKRYRMLMHERELLMVKLKTQGS